MAANNNNNDKEGSALKLSIKMGSVKGLWPALGPPMVNIGIWWRNGKWGSTWLRSSYNTTRIDPNIMNGCKWWRKRPGLCSSIGIAHWM
jgi:hypothetical protein